MPYSIFSQSIIVSSGKANSTYIFGVVAAILEVMQAFTPLLQSSFVDYAVRLQYVVFYIALLQVSHIMAFAPFLTTENSQVLRSYAFISCNINVLIAITIFVFAYHENSQLFAFVLATPLIVGYQMDLIYQRYVSAFLQQLTAFVVQLASYAVVQRQIAGQFLMRCALQLVVYAFFLLNSYLSIKNEHRFQLTLKPVMLKVFLYNGCFCFAQAMPSLWMSRFGQQLEFQLVNSILQATQIAFSRLGTIVCMFQTNYLSLGISLFLIVAVAVGAIFLFDADRVGIVLVFSQMVSALGKSICVVYKLPGIVWQLFAFPHVIVLVCQLLRSSRMAVSAYNVYYWSETITFTCSAVFLVISFRMSHRERQKSEFLAKL